MKLQQDIDFTTLNWVKQELDETLNQARQALEAYVDDPADTSLMRFCATYLHQVQVGRAEAHQAGVGRVVDIGLERLTRLVQGLVEFLLDPVQGREVDVLLQS